MQVHLGRATAMHLARTFEKRAREASTAAVRYVTSVAFRPGQAVSGYCLTVSGENAPREIASVKRAAVRHPRTARNFSSLFFPLWFGSVRVGSTRFTLLFSPPPGRDAPRFCLSVARNASELRPLK